MYCITDQQIEYILNDIRRNGIETEDLQLNLLDHICCIMEQTLKEDDDFEGFYHQTIKRFYKQELREIEEETINLLTFKNYYAMKKVMIACGAISVAAFIGGSIFKAMHWSGASFLLIMGMLTLSVLFLPLMVILKAREKTTVRDKVVTVIGALLGVLYATSTLFAVQHWPGRTTLWLTTVSIALFLFIPFYFFTGIRNAETKLNTIVTSILLVGATCLVFTMIALRPKQPETQVYTYLNNEALLKKMQEKAPVNSLEGQLVADINNTSEQIKGMILHAATGKDTKAPVDENIAAEFTESNIGDGFHVDRSGYKLMMALKEKVNAYNASRQGTGARIPVAHTILNADFTKLEFYNNLYTLNDITQLQMFLASARSTQAVSMK